MTHNKNLPAIDALPTELGLKERYAHEFQEPKVIPIDRLERLQNLPGNSFLPEVTRIYEEEPEF